jgi:hypothetical protein
MRLLDDPEFPRDDWRCMEVADVLEAHDGRGEVPCEACATPVRYLHVLEHDGYDGGVVSCLGCSSSLTGNPAAARAFEAKARAKGEARDAWLSAEWRETPAGAFYTEAGGLRMGVFPARNGGWGMRIEDTFFPQRWPTREQARYALFEEFRSLDKKNRKNTSA